MFLVGCENPSIEVKYPEITTTPGDLPKYVYIHIPTPFVATDNTTNNITTKVIILKKEYILQSTTKTSNQLKLNDIIDSRGNIWNITKIYAPINNLTFNSLTGLFYDGLNPNTSTVNYYLDLQMSNSEEKRIVSVNLFGIKFPYYLSLSEISESSLIDSAVYIDSAVIVFIKLPSFN